MSDHVEAGSLRDRLRAAVSEAWGLNTQLEAVIAEPTPHYGSSLKHGKVSAAPLPWHAAAAWLILELHAEAREMEAAMRMCAGQPVRQRGGSGSNTGRALEAVAAVSWAVDDGRVGDSLRWVQRWCARAKTALGELDAPRRLPRSPGSAEPRCPWCMRPTLRFWALSGVVRCVNPACRDEDDHRPRAKMEVSSLTGDWELYWQDNSVGVPA